MVGAYDWEGGVLKESKEGQLIPSREAFEKEFPLELKNHAAYLGNFSLHKTNHQTINPSSFYLNIYSYLLTFSDGQILCMYIFCRLHCVIGGCWWLEEVVCCWCAQIQAQRKGHLVWPHPWRRCHNHAGLKWRTGGNLSFITIFIYTDTLPPSHTSPILWVLQYPSFLSWSFIAFSLSPSFFTPHSCSLTINELIFILNKSKQVSFTQAASKIKVILRTKSTIKVPTVMENLDKSGEF